MDHLVTMRAFVETVKKGSLTKAASSLGTSGALVSRQIQDLESRLGVRLMHRTTRKIALTAGGEKYFHFCDTMLSQISEMEQELAEETGAAEGVLAILSPKWVGSCAAADAAAAFAKAYPSIKPKLSLGGMSPGAYNFLEQGFDVALHTRDMPDSRIKAKRVATIQFVLCASPDYLRHAITIRSPSDLSAHKGLVQFNYPSWAFENEGKTVTASPQRVFESNSYLSLHRAALGGLGLAILPRSLAQADMEAGRLVEILPSYAIEPHPLYVAMAPGDATPAKIRLFVEFISEWFRAHPL